MGRIIAEGISDDSAVSYDSTWNTKGVYAVGEVAVLSVMVFAKLEGNDRGFSLSREEIPPLLAQIQLIPEDFSYIAIYEIKAANSTKQLQFVSLKKDFADSLERYLGGDEDVTPYPPPGLWLLKSPDSDHYTITTWITTPHKEGDTDVAT